MSILPDELWRRILEIGVEICVFTYKDLCCISISSRRLHRLSNDNYLWSLLLSSDFPSSTWTSLASSTSSFKSLYKIRFERDRDRKIAAHRRAVLRKESQIAEHSRKLREIGSSLVEETEKLRGTVSELSSIHKVRQASVALNVWQPEVIRGRQKQIVEQCTVPVESRSHSLEMELKLCKQQIAIFEKAFKDEKRRLDSAKEELVSMKYHPLRDLKFANSSENGCHVKIKKSKTCDKHNSNTL